MHRIPVFAVGLALALAAAACDGESDVPTPTQSPEFLLAAIETGSSNPSAADVARFSRVLDRLQGTCDEPRTVLSDYIVKTRELLQEEGVEMDLYHIGNEVSHAIVAGDRSIPCAEVFAIWAALNRPFP